MGWGLGKIIFAKEESEVGRKRLRTVGGFLPLL
jgi:hypothetical protein